ncbi:MAG: non-homologous end-joining DNA ligase [Terrimicrobiaceae bacterium]
MAAGVVIRAGQSEQPMHHVPMSLKDYARKRDFTKTKEPKAEESAMSGHRFVVQKHDATRLHYDFRLELGGALKSWAVPKGIPFEKGEKRLAVEVEDHPVSYIDFEGSIPKGEYGGGTVMVWDRGTFEPLSKAPEKELSGGKLHFILNGEKLQGEWYLVRLRDEKQWLLIRGGENMRPISKKLDDTSALSGKSMKELSKGDRVWRSRPKEEKSSPGGRKRDLSAPLPAFVEPMKALLAESPPHGDWVYEIKFDGFRALALKGGNETRLLSRNEKDFGGKFPEVIESISELNVRDAIIDGEIVALDEKGLSSFQLLQAFELGKERPPIFFYAFDLLRLDGKDFGERPLRERKAALQKLLRKAPGVVRFSASLGEDADELLRQARAIGLEGLVGKRKNSVYEPGRRSGAWIKLKFQSEQEFVIGGYTAPSGTRKHFGALLVGVYEGEALTFVGKVGTGFDVALLRNLHSRFEKIRRDTCPFTNLPEKRSARYGQTVTAAEMKRCRWVEPRMVCQVKFSEWTRDGKLRQPVFLGLREDKNARDVVREKAS